MIGEMEAVIEGYLEAMGADMMKLAKADAQGKEVVQHIENCVKIYLLNEIRVSLNSLKVAIEATHMGVDG